jgi:hypothetical protein
LRLRLHGHIFRIAIPGNVEELTTYYPGLPVRQAYRGGCIADLAAGDLVAEVERNRDGL